MVVPMRHDEDRIQKNAELIGEVLNGAIKIGYLSSKMTTTWGLLVPSTPKPLL